jgi:hypothetical protein
MMTHPSRPTHRHGRAGFAAAAASAAPEPSQQQLPDVNEIYHPSITQPSSVDVSAYVLANYKPYAGDASFLAGPSERTKALWAQLEDLIHQELKKGGPRWAAPLGGPAGRPPALGAPGSPGRRQPVPPPAAVD